MFWCFRSSEELAEIKSSQSYFRCFPRGELLVLIDPLFVAVLMLSLSTRWPCTSVDPDRWLDPIPLPRVLKSSANTTAFGRS